jgi:AMIN domain
VSPSNPTPTLLKSTEMRRVFLQITILLGLLTPALHAAPKPAATPSVLQSVTVTSAPSGITLEISASQSVPQLRSQLATDPDRLVLDFPNTQPAADLHSKLINQGDLKGYRVARFSATPLVTRVVIDLNSPQHYQIFPDGKTVIVKLMSDQQQAAGKAHVDNVSLPAQPAQPAPKLDVEYKNGRLSVVADHVSLAQILNEVHRQTGTEITIPPGGGQEQIVVGISPLPLREALVSLLNGSRFNFIMVDSEHEPGKLKSVILTYRSSGGGASEPAIAPPAPPVTQGEPEPVPSPEPEIAPSQAEPQQQPEGQQETPPQQDNQQAPQPQDVPPPQQQN